MNHNDYWASWQPQNVPPGGALYRIDVYVPDLTDEKTWHATYHIAHWLGQSTVIVDQEGLGNRWVTLGYYVMRSGNLVYVDSATGEDTQGRAVMADALTFTSLDTTYLPHYQQGTSVNTSLFVQNTSGPGFAYTVFFNSNGAVVCSSHGYIFANQTSSGASCPGASSAIVYSTQESAVVLRQQTTTGTLNLDNGFWDNAGTDPTFEQKGAYLYVPSFYNNIFSNWNSTLYLMNVGSIATGVDILFKGRVGYGDTTISIPNLPANGTYQIPSSNAWGTTSWVGSVVIISNNMHVVAQVIDSNATLGTNRSANAADQGRTVLYWPDAYKNMWNKTSGLVIQSTATSGNANATLYFYDRDGTFRGSYTLTNIGPERAVGLLLDNSALNNVLPSSWTGAVRIESTQPVAAIAQTRINEVLRCTNLVYQTSQFFYLPRIARNDGGSNTGYIIHNPSNYSITVTARYYYLTGTLFPAATITFSIPAYGTVGRSQNIDPLGTSWVGSVVLSASGPIVAVAEELSGSSIYAGYNGMRR